MTCIQLIYFGNAGRLNHLVLQIDADDLIPCGGSAHGGPAWNGGWGRCMACGATHLSTHTTQGRTAHPKHRRLSVHDVALHLYAEICDYDDEAR